MIEIVQFPWSNFCAVPRRILGFTGEKFKIINIPNGDRALVWKLTKGQYYAVPVLRDGRKVIFETGDDTQDVARYLDRKFSLGLFPKQLAGLQEILWNHIEDVVEGFGFKISDSYWREYVPASDALRFVRHKERKFGRGCLDRWRVERPQLLAGFIASLAPYEAMLASHPYLLDERPRFVDFDLYGMIFNFLYPGHYALPKQHPRIREWYSRMDKIKLSQIQK